MTRQEAHNTRPDIIMGNGIDQTPTQEIGSCIPSSTSASTSSPNYAGGYESYAFAPSEVVIWSFEDSSFTYMTKNQLLVCIRNRKSWTRDLTWTRPRISSDSFEVKIEVFSHYVDEDAPPVCVQRYTETIDISMPYKVYFNRSLPASVRKFENIFICRKSPELDW